MLDWNLNDGNKSKDSKGKITYAKLPEGVSRIRLLLGDGEAPHMRWTHWMPQFKRKLTCAGYDCPIDILNKKAKAEGVDSPYNASRTFAVNIWNYDTNQVEILEEGITMIEALKDELSEIMEDSNVSRPRDIILKVRKKKNSSGKWTWKFTLDSVVDMEPNVEAAFEARTDFVEYYAPPTVEQVSELLQVTAGSYDEYVSEYNRILGYAKKDDAKESENEDIGVEVE